jgi:glycosyltransferase involved in cell wall biosynthesis
MLIIRKRWGHMGPQSGSDLLFESLAESTTIDSVFIDKTVVPGKSVIQRLLERFHFIPKESLWSLQLSSINGVKEIYAFKNAIDCLRKNPNTTLFVSCGEEQLSRQLIRLEPGIKKRIYILLHQPPSWYDSQPGFLGHLSGLGGVFVFSKQMKAYMDKLVDAPVVSIMHGVDLDFFNPGINQVARNGKSIICVGNWYRDFELLGKVWSRLHQFDQDLKLTLITSNEALKNEWFQSLIQQPNVVHQTGLGSNQLLESYQSACLHLLPLSDGVANNALVESLATACPVLATNIESVSEYVPQDHFGLANKGDVEDHYQKTISLLSDSKLRNEMARNQRRFALSHLSWSNISQQVIAAVS